MAEVDYDAVSKAVQEGVSRAFGKSPTQLWPSPSPRPDIQVIAAEKVKLQLKWGDHAESYELTPAEILDIHSVLCNELRTAYERQTTPAA